MRPPYLQVGSGTGPLYFAPAIAARGEGRLVPVLARASWCRSIQCVFDRTVTTTGISNFPIRFMVLVCTSLYLLLIRFPVVLSSWEDSKSCGILHCRSKYLGEFHARHLFGDWPPVLQDGADGASGVPFRVASPMWRVATTATPELPFIRHPKVRPATLLC